MFLGGAALPAGLKKQRQKQATTKNWRRHVVGRKKPPAIAVLASVRRPPRNVVTHRRAIGGVGILSLRSRACRPVPALRPGDPRDAARPKFWGLRKHHWPGRSVPRQKATAQHYGRGPRRSRPGYGRLARKKPLASGSYPTSSFRRGPRPTSSQPRTPQGKGSGLAQYGPRPARAGPCFPGRGQKQKQKP
jgi:hypothetical protein